MILKHSGQRVAVLIDVQNLYHSAKNLYASRVNFREILKLAVNQRSLIRAFAYVVRTKTGEEKPFFEALSKLGIETRVKDLQEFYGGLKKADWDVGIAMDAIRLADKLDVIVLVTGDGDFLPLLSYLQNTKGTLVEIIAFRQTTSSHLIEEADDFINLSESRRFLLKSS